MTTTSTDLQELAARAAAATGWTDPEARVTAYRGGWHVEIAMPYNSGAGLGICCPTQARTGYGWDFISDDRITGAWSSARFVGDSIDIDPDSDDDPEPLITGLAERVAAMAHAAETSAAAAITRSLVKQLADVLDQIAWADAHWDSALGVFVDEAGDAVQVDADRNTDEPGVFVDEDAWLVAWDYDPRRPDEVIEARVALVTR